MAIDLNRAHFDKMSKFHKWIPHKAQNEVLDVFFSGQRFMSAQFGRQSGKTEVLAHIVDYATDQPNKLIWAMAPTYQLTGRLWNAMYPLVSARHGSDLKVIRTSPPKMILPWNTRVEFRSGESPDSNIGAGIDLLAWDEAAVTNNGESLWQLQLRACLAMRQAQVFMTTTPRGHNWYYDLVTRAEWWMRQYPSHCNPYLPPEELENMKREMDEIRYRQEVLAQFVAFAGMVYSMFDMDTHVISDEEAAFITRDWRTSVTCDPGMNNTMIQLIKHHPITGEDIVIRDVKLQNTIFDDALRILNEWRPPEGYEVCVCDVAGKARGHETGRSFVGWMRDHGYEFRHTGVKSIVEGVNMVRGRLRNVNGEVHLKFAKAANDTIQMLLNYHFPENKTGTQGEEPEKDGVYDHAADALRYYITWRHRGVSRAVKH